MSTWPGVARRASTVSGIVVSLAAAVVFGGCGGSGGSTSSSTTTALTRAPFGFNNLPPATVPPGGCVSVAGASSTVTVTVDDRGFTPRCVTVAATQTLRVRNTGRSFHNVVVEDLTSNLAPGDTQTWDELGQYLAPGNYLLYSESERNQALYPTFHTTLVITGNP